MKNEIEKLIIEWNKKIGKKSPDIIGYDLIELGNYIYNKAFALGKKDMLEEVKKEIDGKINDVYCIKMSHDIKDVEWCNKTIKELKSFKQRLENLNIKKWRQGHDRRK